MCINYIEIRGINASSETPNYELSLYIIIDEFTKENCAILLFWVSNISIHILIAYEISLKT